MSEMKSLTLNDKTYDCFVDSVARSSVVVGSASGESIAVSDSSNQPLVGLNIYGKSTQAGTPTPDAPVDIISVSGNVKTSINNSNVIPFPYYDGYSKTTNGITFLVNEDGSVTANGTATAEALFMLCYEGAAIRLPKGHYYLSGCPVGGEAGRYQIYVRNGDKTYTARDKGNGVAINLDSEATGFVCIIDILSGATVNNLVFRPMLNIGSTARPYQKNINTMVETEVSQMASVPTTDTRRVTYTDVDGRMLCADEIDLGRGVHVQRIGIIENYNNESVSGAYLSTTGKLSKGALVQYILETPIETPLEEAEIASFKALHTNKPNTTVLNDSGAFMSMNYIADTKSYIDNKVSGILAATVE